MGERMASAVFELVVVAVACVDGPSFAVGVEGEMAFVRLVVGDMVVFARFRAEHDVFVRPACPPDAEAAVAETDIMRQNFFRRRHGGQFVLQQDGPREARAARRVPQIGGERVLVVDGDEHRLEADGIVAAVVSCVHERRSGQRGGGEKLRQFGDVRMFEQILPAVFAEKPGEEQTVGKAVFAITCTFRVGTVIIDAVVEPPFENGDDPVLLRDDFRIVREGDGQKPRRAAADAVEIMDVLPPCLVAFRFGEKMVQIAFGAGGDGIPLRFRHLRRKEGVAHGEAAHRVAAAAGHCARTAHPMLFDGEAFDHRQQQ